MSSWVLSLSLCNHPGPDMYRPVLSGTQCSHEWHTDETQSSRLSPDEPRQWPLHSCKKNVLPKVNLWTDTSRDSRGLKYLNFMFFLSRKITSTERKVTFCKNTKSLLSFLAFLCEKSKHIFILLSFSGTIRKKESPSTSPVIKFTTTASDLHQVILQDNGGGCLNSPTDRINSGSLVNVT